MAAIQGDDRLFDAAHARGPAAGHHQCIQMYHTHYGQRRNPPDLVGRAHHVAVHAAEVPVGRSSSGQLRDHKWTIAWPPMPAARCVHARISGIYCIADHECG